MIGSVAGKVKVQNGRGRETNPTYIQIHVYIQLFHAHSSITYIQCYTYIQYRQQSHTDATYMLAVSTFIHTESVYCTVSAFASRDPPLRSVLCILYNVVYNVQLIMLHVYEGKDTTVRCRGIRYLCAVLHMKRQKKRPRRRERKRKRKRGTISQSY